VTDTTLPTPLKAGDRVKWLGDKTDRLGTVLGVEPDGTPQVRFDNASPAYPIARVFAVDRLVRI
jgi:hypothetical protein